MRHLLETGPIWAVLAFVILAAAGLWLVAVALLMALRPNYCLQLLAKMATSLEASNWRLQFTEQGLRIVAGAALIVRAPVAKLPSAFEIAGWLLVISSLVIIVLPIRWHGRYGAFLVRWLSPSVLRILWPIPATIGAGLIYAAI